MVVAGRASPGRRLESGCGTGRVVRLGQGTGCSAGTRSGGFCKDVRGLGIKFCGLSLLHSFLRCELPPYN